MAFDDVTFWFGEHNGERLADIPVHYLDWFIGEEWDSERVRMLKIKVETHLEGRDDWHAMDSGAPSVEETDVCPKCAEDLTKSGWCVTCNKYPFGKKDE